MTPPPKRPRALMRLPQCNKVLRLVRRSLNQWVAQAPVPRNSPITRYSIADAEWKADLP
jgi:hypothetical protein